MPKEVAPEERELLLKEAQWIREDVSEAWKSIQRFQAVYVAAVYGIAVWMVGQILQQPTAADVGDQYFWTLRTRFDVALAVCAVPVLNLISTLLLINAGARWLALNIQLARVARKLGSGTTWTWRLDLESVRYVKILEYTTTFGIGVPVATSFLAALWFIRPAAQQSTIVATAWCVALAALVLGTAATGLFVRIVRKHIGEQVNAE